MGCRHGRGGRHRRALSGLLPPAPDYHPDLACQSHLLEPCLGFGKGESGKAPGVVVHDLLKKARIWCDQNGLGSKARQPTSRSGRALGQRDDLNEEDYLQALRLVDLGHAHAHPSQSDDEFNPTMSQEEALRLVEDGLDDLEEDTTTPVAGSPQVSAVEQATPRVAESEVADASEDSSPLMSDILLDSEPLCGSSPPRAANAKEGSRVSTQMRVATLAILAQVSSDVHAFRRRFWELREGDQSVLHLCGCGLQHTNTDTGKTVSGCVRPSHLILGTAETNQRHLVWHKAFNMASTDEDYLSLVEIAQRASTQDCAGLF